MKKLTYEDWYNGDVIIDYKIELLDFFDNDSLEYVSWDSFNEIDSQKIRKKQKELFKVRVNTKLSYLKNSFRDRYNISKFKNELIEQEKKHIDEVLKNGLRFPINKKNHLFEDYTLVDLNEILSYFTKVIVEGFDVGYDFILSPNYKSYNESRFTPQVYAYALFDYKEWLEYNFNSKEVIETEKITLPPFFSCKKTYDFFLELQELLVDKKTIYADYSFIFHKMQGRGYIKEGVKHRTFIEFLKSNYNVELNYDKFQFKNQEKHRNIFDKIEKKYI